MESAGSWDYDSELTLYSKNLWKDFGKIQMDFRKGQVDILQIQKFLSAMILHDKDEMTSYLQSAGSAPQVKSTTEGFTGFINWLGGNSVELDSTKMNTMFHTNPPLLMENETIEKIYKTGRDMFVYTTHRVLLVDVQGLRGKKVEYLSIPHTSIKGYEVETAGHLDRYVRLSRVSNKKKPFVIVFVLFDRSTDRPLLEEESRVVCRVLVVVLNDFFFGLFSFFCLPTHPYIYIYILQCKHICMQRC